MTDNAIARIDAQPLVEVGRHADEAEISPAKRLEQWLKGLNANTRRAYERDLEAFAAHVKEPSAGALLTRLAGLRRARALVLLEDFRDHLVREGKSSATINRKLASANSALKALATADIGPGRLDVKPVKAEPRRDARGPGLVNVAIAMRQVQSRRTPEALRDAAIVRLACQRGLRRAEIVALDLNDVDLEAAELAIVRKGHRERVKVKMGSACVQALRAWLPVRARLAAPDETAVFIGLGKSMVGHRLTGAGLYAIVRRTGELIGQSWRPHGLRHTGVSHVLKETKGNIEAAREFAGHSSIATTQRYLDDREEYEAAAIASIDDAF